MSDFRTPSAYGPRRPQPAPERTFDPTRSTAQTPAVKAQWVKEYKQFIGVLATALPPDELMRICRDGNAAIAEAYKNGA